jgi:hypothetical protein
VVILKGDDDKEYFLNTLIRIKILGPASEASSKKGKQQPVAPAPRPRSVAQPERTPNTATQGI